ncbi:glutamate mutase L [Desulfopila inferna]|uniref:glutamate mutase L n=1 Tax=Desulfopila inferna TaxID=468528 RepID=UPI001963BD88|nr:glutamate mutase L [Desulfopila inferna]MBM9604480.1 glutamate mutase L [Desulfopila inferna]
MEANLVVYDVGSTYTKVTAFSMIESHLSLLARDQVPTTVTDIQSGIANANEAIAKRGIRLTEESRFFSTSSAAGGLRMVAMGYMPRVTAKAAKEVSMNAGARVLEIVTHEDPPEYRIEILREIQPDIILLAGGTDGGDYSNIIENARHIVASKVKAVVIIAGNISAQMEVQEILSKAGVLSKRVANVMPTIHELKVDRAREAIHEEFIKQISLAKGLNKLVDIVSDNVIIPTPGAILMAAELLACGTFAEDGVGDIIVIDIGGATTDIHSIIPGLEKLSIEERGLVITNEKQAAYRTVEGNLGMRISATGILETVGPAGVLAKIGKSGDEFSSRLKDYTVFLEENPEHIAATEIEHQFDRALAISAIEIALKRHAGYIAQEYNPVMGIAPGTPIGRDLRGITKVIAVGGLFAHTASPERETIIKEAMKNRGVSLLPESYSVYFDDKYLMYVIGALSRKYPDKALQFAKQYLMIS